MTTMSSGGNFPTSASFSLEAPPLDIACEETEDNSTQIFATDPEEDDEIRPEIEEEDEFLDAEESLSPTVENSDIFDIEWKSQWKHFFVLSEAGKPIYCTHGDEDALSSLTAVMQAHVSFVQDLGDSIRDISFNDCRIAFLVKGPLILVASTRGVESYNQLIGQLTYVYNQILSVLTLKQLTKIFEKKKSYDLRLMLGGAERLLNHLTKAFEIDHSFMLSSVRVLPLPTSTRVSVASAISQCLSKIKNVVFAILLAENQLISLLRMKQYFIHPADLHLLFNFVNASESFKDSESWTPICLPKFNNSGFLHAHVSYLKDDVPICLLMLTVQKNIFFELSEAKKKIVATLEKNNCISVMMESLKASSSFDSKSVGVPEIRHFLYKLKASSQFISTKFSAPYCTEEDTLRLQNVYFLLHNRLNSTLRPSKLIFYSGRLENVLAWSTRAFDVYASFDPLCSKILALNAVNKLLRWIKKEENSLFIHSAPTF